MVSLLSIDGTLIHQSVVVTLDGVFHDGGKGGGLVGAFAVFLNGGYQFHRLFTQADAELLRSIGMVVCHCCWDVSGDSGVGFRQHQQGSGSALTGTSVGFLGKGVGGANLFGFLAPQRFNYSTGNW